MNLKEKMDNKEYLTAFEMIVLFEKIVSSRYPEVHVTVAKPPIFGGTPADIVVDDFNYYKYVALTLALYKFPDGSQGFSQKDRLGYVTVRVNFNNDFSSFEFFNADYKSVGKHKLTYSKTDYTLPEYLKKIPTILGYLGELKEVK